MMSDEEVMCDDDGINPAQEDMMYDMWKDQKYEAQREAEMMDRVEEIAEMCKDYMSSFQIDADELIRELREVL